MWQWLMIHDASKSTQSVPHKFKFVVRSIAVRNRKRTILVTRDPLQVIAGKHYAIFSFIVFIINGRIGHFIQGCCKRNVNLTHTDFLHGQTESCSQVALLCEPPLEKCLKSPQKDVPW
uniref:Uncharacterized protein n=1 Tax=Odontella aurita TaxID=265563 RepID=A0A7S4JPV2_9STRA|mmetsp:Transcript_51443/g.154473  ORF Transcript_51443/g.154473 Transcript_51443/m.154473 type:complete len:118 (+) Transcript_51443:179-532(+)